MSSEENRNLRRLKPDDAMPPGFSYLSEDEQRSVAKRLVEQDIELRRDGLSRLSKSRVAENDISMGLDAIQRLDDERKIFSEKLEGETGSGKYKVEVRGGDTNIIIAIIIAVVVVILGVVFIFVVI